MENEPVTKDYLHQELGGLEQRVEKKIQDAETRIVDSLTATIRDAQTEVLRAFYNWARPLEMRVKHVDELQSRMSLVEDRVAELERGRLMGGK